MPDTPVSDAWAGVFGLASVPLFAAEEVGADTHTVLLDGGFGSFALSLTAERLWRERRSYEWAWSSGLPHHVTVTDTEVAVVRWDSPEPEEFSRRSVEARLEAFYGYLRSDRVQSSRRVVDHLVDGFRRVRSLVDQIGLGDEHSVEAFLYTLEVGMERSGHGLHYTANSSGFSAILPENSVEQIINRMMTGPIHAPNLRLHPELAIRHAGSEIFQEAHFSLTSASTADLFDWVGPATAKRETRGTAHFTPPALARSIVEQTLGSLDDLSSRQTLVIYDPACGSGSFLYEALRTLRRLNFAGRITVVGRDVSPAAISMAKFTLALAISDWHPAGGITIDLSVADFLTAELMYADIILMNPPFLSWSAMSPKQREQMRELMGPLLKGRADLSMVFVSRAVKCLHPGGALGVLIPSSLLNLLSAEKWREAITLDNDIRMIASLGDYGLFRHAMVQVAAMVLSRKEGAKDRPNATLAIIASNAADATGDALRAIRRGERSTGSGAVTAKSGNSGWRTFELPSEAFSRKPTWRLIAPEATSALERLEAIGATRPLREIFDVYQGVRTGDNDSFIVSKDFYASLPKSEHMFFRAATMGDNIIGGQLRKSEYIFYPYNENGLLLTSEAELARSVPRYFQRVLAERRDKLMLRSDIRRTGREDWWGLSQRREWGTSKKPRIVSKYFGKEGSFALDETAEYVVVQGFAWFPRWPDPSDIAEGPDVEDDERDYTYRSPVTTVDLLFAYSAIFNSEPFQRLLLQFSAYVGGGQADLSPRFVNEVPVPDLMAMAADDANGQRLSRLTSLGRNIKLDDYDWRHTVKRIVIELYGIELFERI
ncbi:N-6 DNA methylase [Methylobacterium sp. GXS13]|uniref:N-6 DNA methylase n=1 Tax=Methylobacterium sp. GXS13 TaxID=1730094 RepID=UPI0009EA17B0|nr:N-6 DNA methylase [Methylobacterium sp. GXS13]